MSKISHIPVYHMYYKKQAKLSYLRVLSKRNVFLFPSVKASVTVEAALVLPLFLFFCIQLISLIGLFQLHSAITAALHQETAQLSLQAYAYEKAGGETGKALSTLVGETYLREKVIQRAGETYLNNSMIEGGSAGIGLLPALDISTSENPPQDVVGARLSYRIKPVIDILGFSGFSMGNVCYMKAWTGYRLCQDGEENPSEEELVYITETGTVYHKSRRCTHLALSVREVELDQLGVLRNESGGKYYACEHCADKAGGGVFLTDQGNRYHTSLLCSGLKRTIYVIKISEAGGRGACSRCAGME